VHKADGEAATGELPAIDPQLLSALEAAPAALRVSRGIEKESLRVTPEGQLSQRPHPAALGSPLTHPHITTDFSEAQLELITEPLDDPASALAQLIDIHQYVYRHLDGEVLWAASMPCMLGQDSDIPVGRYGSSNIAQAKTVYRLGLGNRYGRLMQTISGIHYNFSVPEAFWPVLAAARGRSDGQDFRTEAYFGLIRNFRRHSWLLIYLYGASPAVCKSFVQNRPHALESFDEGSLYLPHATSLRMGGLGYQSDAQSALHISYNSLGEYAGSMTEALTREYPAYARIGVKGPDGSYRQLNTALLQIENEFYGTIRPKQPVHPGERPLHALEERGVAYVEVRCLDLDPFLPVGIDDARMRFIDTFLLYCLCAPSPPDSPEESQRLRDNQRRVVERGREPGLALATGDAAVALADQAREILRGCAPLAALFDQGDQASTQAWQAAADGVADPSRLPSARILEAMAAERIPFFRFAMNQSLAHRDSLTARAPRPRAQQRLGRQSRESVTQQQHIEASDQEDFDSFLESYLAL